MTTEFSRYEDIPNPGLRHFLSDGSICFKDLGLIDDTSMVSVSSIKRSREFIAFLNSGLHNFELKLNHLDRIVFSLIGCNVLVPEERVRGANGYRKDVFRRKHVEALTVILFIADDQKKDFRIPYMPASRNWDALINPHVRIALGNNELSKYIKPKQEQENEKPEGVSRNEQRLFASPLTIATRITDEQLERLQGYGIDKLSEKITEIKAQGPLDEVYNLPDELIPLIILLENFDRASKPKDNQTPIQVVDQLYNPTAIKQLEYCLKILLILSNKPNKANNCAHLYNAFHKKTVKLVQEASLRQASAPE